MTIISTSPATNGNGHTANGHSSSGPGAQRPAAAPLARPADRRGVVQVLRDIDAAERNQATQPQPPAGGFSPEQLTALASPLDPARICTRKQGRASVPYLKGWAVIEEANAIFGFDGWQRQTLACQCVTQAERPIGEERKPGWGVTYIARVRITVFAGSRGLLIREGTGAGHGYDTDLGLAHESAIKEAETDAMKRALVTFGARFGLSLYDRHQRPMGGAAPQAARPAPQGAANGVVRRLPPAQAQLAPAGAAPAPDAPLDPPTIRSLHERIRGLLPPQLAAFSQAFRRAFQVPAEIPTIAELITQQRHQLWIQRYLNQAQTHTQAQAQGQLQARTA
ncbi:MAG: RAD52 family DNA repair protein [Synechococcaceae cyanobacterium]